MERQLSLDTMTPQWQSTLWTSITQNKKFTYAKPILQHWSQTLTNLREITVDQALGSDSEKSN